MPNDLTAIQIVLRAQRIEAILGLLDGVLCGTANDQILAELLRTVGVAMARAELRTLLNLLAREDAIELTEHGNLIVIQLKGHGREIVQGVTIIEGMKRMLSDSPYALLS